MLLHLRSPLIRLRPRVHPSDRRAGVHHIREFAVEARERRTMHRLSWDQLAVGCLPWEGSHGVRKHPGLEAEIARHARGRGDAVVGRQAHERDRVDAVGAQTLLEVGPDERRIDVLRDHGLAWQWRGLGLEFGCRRTGEKYSL